MASDRVTAAHTRDAAQRHRDYADPVKIGELEASGIYNAARWVNYLREGGFMAEHDASVYLLKSAWSTFTSRKQFDGLTIELTLNGTWVKFRAVEVTDLHRSGEWKLKLDAHVA
jgi:hypothetical protein